MDIIQKELTRNLIQQNVDFYIGFTQHAYNNSLDVPQNVQIQNELERLKGLSFEVHNNTELFTKIAEVFEEDFKLQNLYEEDGETFTSKSMEKALDLYCDYKLEDYINTEVNENINVANEMIHNGIDTKNDELIEQGRILLNPNGGFKTHYENFNNSTISVFRELCIKSRLEPGVILEKIKINEFTNFETFSELYVPYVRRDNSQTVYTIKSHHNEYTAKGEALNEPKHLTNKKTMENTSTKQKATYEGYVASISEPKKLDSGKEIVTVTIGSSNPEGTKEYKTAQLWFDEKSTVKSTELPFKKGDTIKVSGMESTTVGKDEKQYTSLAANIKDLAKIEKNKTESLTIKGNVVNDPTSKSVGENKVTSFSIAINKEGEEKPEFVKVSAWDKNQKGEINKDLYSLSTAKKGDFVELTGFVKPNEYTNDKGEKVVSNDFVATGIKTISTSLARNASVEQKNEYLLKAVQSGNFKEVDVALKAGADIKLAKTYDLSSLTEKQQKAITDIISKAELGEKKNNSIKM
jgi:single-stranded DNA-binding protein